VQFPENVAQRCGQGTDGGEDRKAQPVGVPGCRIGILSQHHDTNGIRRGELEGAEQVGGCGEDGVPGGDLGGEETIQGSESFRCQAGRQGSVPWIRQRRDHAPASPGSGSASGASPRASSPLSAGDSAPENFHTPLKRAVKRPPPRRVLRKKVHVSG